MDARIVIDEYRLKLRTTGIIIHDNKILIEKYDDKVYFLPGGTINLYETSSDAIVRELKEELDKDFVIDELVSIKEEFYISKVNGLKNHHINFYYKMKFKNEDDIDSIDLNRLENDHGNEVKHHYKWVFVDDLKDIKLIPEDIKQEIINDTYAIHSVVEKE